jgi:glycerol-1-phosphate dehydrogenase [NAD(P)+]
MVAAPLTVDIRRGAVSGLAALLTDSHISSDGHVAVVVGPGQGERVVAEVRPALGNAEIYPVEGGSREAAADLADRLRSGSYDAIVGIGGGRTLDVAKYAAGLTGLPMVAVATNLAHDGIASPVASLEYDGRKGSYGVHVPIAVFVDLDYVRTSPPEQLRSGVGDALSNLNALADWELAARERGEPFDGLAAAFARAGAESLLNRDEELTSDEFLTGLAEALVLSGLAMAVAGSSRPCSGACHEISHAIDALFPETASHGQQVAVGALFASSLREDGSADVLDAAPDLGLTEEQFAQAVALAPSTRPDRFTILEHLDLGEEEIAERVRRFVHAFDR